MLKDKAVGQAAKMLEDYADELGNRGCNDYDWPDDWSPIERAEFIRRFYWFNSQTTIHGGPEQDELLSDLQRMKCPPDFCFAATLADILRNG